MKQIIKVGYLIFLFSIGCYQVIAAEKTELLKTGSPKVLELVNSVINKFLNKDYSETKVREKLNSYKNNEKINKLTSIKYINWLFK